MGEIIQDESQWPILHVTMAGDMTVADVQKWMPMFLNLTKRQQVFTAIFDVRKNGNPSSDVSKAVKDLMDPERQALRKYVAGAVLVVNSMAMSVALNALLLLVRPPYPTKVVNTIEQAEAHCRSLLKPGAQRASA